MLLRAYSKVFISLMLLPPIATAADRNDYVPVSDKPDNFELSYFGEIDHVAKIPLVAEAAGIFKSFLVDAGSEVRPGQNIAAFQALKIDYQDFIVKWAGQPAQLITQYVAEGAVIAAGDTIAMFAVRDRKVARFSLDISESINLKPDLDYKVVSQRKENNCTTHGRLRKNSLKPLKQFIYTAEISLEQPRGCTFIAGESVVLTTPVRINQKVKLPASSLDSKFQLVVVKSVDGAQRHQLVKLIKQEGDQILVEGEFFSSDKVLSVFKKNLL